MELCNFVITVDVLRLFGSMQQGLQLFFFNNFSIFNSFLVGLMTENVVQTLMLRRARFKQTSLCFEVFYMDINGNKSYFIQYYNIIMQENKR